MCFKEVIVYDWSTSVTFRRLHKYICGNIEKARDKEIRYNE